MIEAPSVAAFGSFLEASAYAGAKGSARASVPNFSDAFSCSFGLGFKGLADG